ncbi:UNKNOWN [Stylonychia lemnae]|uniref:Uncharacterized protein n=1 Tax=Stylonychia lemnae TaxID=5949 RepID=A0A078AYJ5_STYLE|nr:UNKNOWN [Stylonychia lemnae]|eukprot:CDW87490.1 UNKNOWN [Stylonychia lemnae]
MGQLFSRNRNLNNFKFDKKQAPEYDAANPYHVERNTLAKIFMFDLNLGKNPVLTIAKRFARENTNDNCDNLNIAMSDIVLLEFKKYLFLCKIEIQKNQEKYQFLFKGQKYYRSPFPAPYFIRKALNLVILYTEHYEKLCDEIFGGWMDIYQSESIIQEYEDHQRMMNLLKSKDSLLFPFKNIWPEYKTLEEFKRDQKYVEVHMSMHNRHLLKDYLLVRCQEILISENYTPDIPFSTITEKYTPILIDEIQQKFPSSHVKSINDRIEIKISPELQHKLDTKKINESDNEYNLDKLNKIQFSLRFKDEFKVKLQIDDETCEYYLAEYKKFLLMGRYSPRMISPSEQVDHVWHHHQIFTKQYREDMFELYGRLLKHLPAMGGKEDSEKFDDLYQKTLDFYNDMYGYKPDPLMWEPSELRFSSELFTYSMVNLNRVISLSLYRAFNPLPIRDLEEKVQLLDKFDAKYATIRRTNYVNNRRQIRHYLKHQIKLKNDYQVFELMEIRGGPIIMPFNNNPEYLDQIAKQQLDYTLQNGLYSDYRPESNNLSQDIELMQFGAQEVMERLVDLGIGDFDVEGDDYTSYDMIPLRMEINIGKLGNGLQDYNGSEENQT